jgi:pantoate--beta-alanine ligase
VGDAGAAAERKPGGPDIPLVVRTRAELGEALSNAPRPIGLVPTMGSLHAGHASLIVRAREASATVLVSIFVNPRQFNETADFEKYPRDETADLKLAGSSGADLVWIPSVDDVYPSGFQTNVRVSDLTEPLEGAARPGHFEGVTTVVAILLTLAGAEKAFFGQKDAQQLIVVRRMAGDLGIGTEIVACPIVRETDGLALSSRNTRLTPRERAAAPVLRRALLAARAAYGAGIRDGNALRAAMRDVLASEPLAAPEYVSCADTATLRELATVQGPALLSLAVRFGAVRLIDNELLAGGQ